MCGRYQTFAAGCLIGYDFGPVDLQVWMTDQFASQNTPAGNGALDVWTRIGFKIWGPEARKPLVAIVVPDSGGTLVLPVDPNRDRNGTEVIRPD